jgi:hypothetical protein
MHLDAVHRTPRDAPTTDLVINDCIAKWFRNSIDRKGGRNERRQKQIAAAAAENCEGTPTSTRPIRSSLSKKRKDIVEHNISSDEDSD